MISIGFYFLKESFTLAELSLSGREPKVLGVDEIFFSGTSSEEDKQELLSKELSRIKKKYKGQNIRFCFALPQNMVSNFFFQFPFKERFKILKTIPFEIEDRTPFQLNKVLFDVRVCDIQKNNQSSVLCFVTPEENIKNFLSFVEPFKKSVYLLSASAVALSNLLEAWNKPFHHSQNLKSSKAYLYLGVDNSYLFFYKNNVLQNIFVLDWGCLEIIKKMEQTYKLDKKKAWDEFFNKAFVLQSAKGYTKEQIFFSNLVAKNVQPLISKLKLLKVSLETKQALSLSDIIIFGHGSAIKNLSAYLSLEMNMPVSKLKKIPALDMSALGSKNSSLISIGLALEGLKKAPYPGLNFLHLAKEKGLFLNIKSFKARILAFALVFFAFLAYVFIKDKQNFKLLTQIESIFKDYSKKILYLPDNKLNPAGVKKFLKEEKEKEKIEELIKEQLNDESPLDKLSRVTEQIGPAKDWDLRIKYLKISRQRVQIRGLIEPSKLQKFEATLEQIAKKGSVKNKTKLKSLNDKKLGEMPDQKSSLDSKNESDIFAKKLAIENNKADLTKEKEGGSPKDSLDQNTESLKDSAKTEESLKASSLLKFSYSFILKGDE